MVDKEPSAIPSNVRLQRIIRAPDILEARHNLDIAAKTQEGRISTAVKDEFEVAMDTLVGEIIAYYRPNERLNGVRLIGPFRVFNQPEKGYIVNPGLTFSHVKVSERAYTEEDIERIRSKFKKEPQNKALMGAFPGRKWVSAEGDVPEALSMALELSMETSEEDFRRISSNSDKLYIQVDGTDAFIVQGEEPKRYRFTEAGIVESPRRGAADEPVG
jgi:hypothetical protein